ncbi:MAG: hypothetical protein ACRELD_06015 [Longimicrobiales bacterium]
MTGIYAGREASATAPTAPKQIVRYQNNRVEPRDIMRLRGGRETDDGQRARRRQ